MPRDYGGPSLYDLALIAAAKLERRDEARDSFLAEELVVAAWRECPQRFGLRGYEAVYPDSNRVLYNLMGSRGLVARGLLERVAGRRYRLTPDGHAAAEKLRARGEASSNGKAMAREKAPSKVIEEMAAGDELSRLLESDVYVLVMAGESRAEITFTIACKFWGLREGEVGKAVALRLAEVGRLLDRAERELEGSKGFVLADGRHVGEEDLERLRKCHDYLGARFARHLTLLRERKEV